MLGFDRNAPFFILFATARHAEIGRIIHFFFGQNMKMYFAYFRKSADPDQGESSKIYPGPVPDKEVICWCEAKRLLRANKLLRFKGLSTKKLYKNKTKLSN